MNSLFRKISVLVITLLSATMMSGNAFAEDPFKQRGLVDRAKFLLESFNADQDMQRFRSYIKYAHGIMIVPKFIKGAWVVGAGGGAGVLMKLDQTTGEWSNPAFYSLRSFSAGLQVGGSASEMILLIMTEKGLEPLQKNISMKLGVDASVAAGPVGTSVESATPANFSADYISFARSAGAYLGLGLSGTAMVPKNDWNQSYYGQELGPMDILDGHVDSPHAQDLREAMKKFFKDNY